MIKIVKIDLKDNYFVDELTGIIVDKFNPDNKYLNLVTKLEDDSILTVKNEQIIQKYGGQLIFEYKDDKYIIDDGYQNLLIRAGYIVKNKFDISTNFINERSIGIEYRNILFNYIKSEMREFMKEREFSYDINYKENQSIEVIFLDSDSDNKFTIIIETINSVVNKNQQRKLNELPFYPFLKSMDKYCTMYMSIFAKKISSITNSDKAKYESAEKFIIDFINRLNKNATDNDQYRFERTIIRKRINYTEGI